MLFFEVNFCLARRQIVPICLLVEHELRLKLLDLVLQQWHLLQALISAFKLSSELLLLVSPGHHIFAQKLLF